MAPSNGKLKSIVDIGAQGDVLFRRVDSMPAGCKPVARKGDGLVVAHSESGHHHVVEQIGPTLWAHPTDPFLAFLKVPEKTKHVDVVHTKETWDGHGIMRLLTDTPPGAEVIYEIRRQKETSPEGWRQVQD